MRGQQHVKDNMETLFEQHKLHNQGERLAKEEKDQEVPQESKAQGQFESQGPEAKHGSMLNVAL